MRILYASNNQAKIEDVKSAISLINKNIQILSLKDIGLNIEVEETGKTLLENAILKAEEVYKTLKDNNKLQGVNYIIGEDFGFYLDAFPNIAGIHAKRWKSGSNLDRAVSIVKLFNKTGETNKKATFCCAMCCIDKLGNKYEAQKSLTGKIGARIPTQKGFGYHQIVKMEDERYLSDYSLEEKVHIWSRHTALIFILKQIKLI